MSFPRYPKYKDSGVPWLGEVPAHWTTTKLKRVVQSDRPITYGIVQAGPHVPEGIPYVRPADMSDEQGVHSQEEVLRTSSEIAEAYSRSKIRTGDIVCSIGPSFGKVMITPSWLDGGNLTQGTARVAVADPNASRFVFWVLRSKFAVAQWESSIGGATFRALNLGPLADTSLILPPPSEQTTIASFLDRETAKIDALVDEQHRLIELLNEKRQAVISHAVTKGLNPNAPMKPSGVEWPGEVPSHWEVTSIKRFSTLQRGYDLTDAERTEGRYPVVTSGGVTGTHGSYMVRGPGVVTGRYGSTGRLFFIEEDFWPHNTALYVSDFHGNLPRFVWYSLQTVDFAAHSAKAAVPGVDRNDIHVLPVVVPSLDEQQAVVDHLDNATAKLDTLIAETRQAIALLEERRSALISAVVTGKIDVRGLAKEAAA